MFDNAIFWYFLYIIFWKWYNQLNIINDKQLRNNIPFSLMEGLNIKWYKRRIHNDVHGESCAWLIHAFCHPRSRIKDMSRVWGIFCFPCLNNGWFISYRFSPLMCLLLLNYYTKREWRHAIEYINPLVLNLVARLIPYMYTYFVLQDNIEFLYLYLTQSLCAYKWCEKYSFLNGVM